MENFPHIPQEAHLEILAIIPARGGSKGIPGKNIRLLAGKPLIEHSIAAARSSSLVSRVIVSTDDDHISDVARQAGAEVVKRPIEISDDKAPSEAALLHVLDRLKMAESYVPEIVVFLQCTSPLTTAADIDGTVAALLQEKADSAFSAVHFYHFLWRRLPGGGVEGINHDMRIRPMRQERDPQFLENGAVYVFRTAGFLQSKYRFFGKVAIHIGPLERCLEIDELHDFELAEIALGWQGSAARDGTLPADAGS